MRACSFALWLCALAGLGGLAGCGGVYYTVSANAAEARLQQAHAMGAETVAPFDYYYAKEHLRQARVEAAEASYGDAAAYAETAEAYAQKAIDATKARRSRSEDAR